MNTGDRLETERLLLFPGLNARDDKPFLKMLKEDGDFRIFCGVDLTERRLNQFANYFERSTVEECIYSVFRKEDPDGFIGYVGFHRELNYEIEFYISKFQRKKGYCTEAAEAVIKLLFSKGLSVDGNVVTVDKLYATTIAENISTIKLLEKLGFRRNITEDGPILVMNAFFDEEDGMFYKNRIVEYVLERDNK